MKLELKLPPSTPQEINRGKTLPYDTFFFLPVTQLLKTQKPCRKSPAGANEKFDVFLYQRNIPTQGCFAARSS